MCLFFINFIYALEASSDSYDVWFYHSSSALTTEAADHNISYGVSQIIITDSINTTDYTLKLGIFHAEDDVVAVVIPPTPPQDDGNLGGDVVEDIIFMKNKTYAPNITANISTSPKNSTAYELKVYLLNVLDEPHASWKSLSLWQKIVSISLALLWILALAFVCWIMLNKYRKHLSPTERRVAVGLIIVSLFLVIATIYLFDFTEWANLSKPQRTLNIFMLLLAFTLNTFILWFTDITRRNKIKKLPVASPA